MNLNDLAPQVTAETVTAQIKKQFGTDYDLAKLGLTESIQLLNKTNGMVMEFKNTRNLHDSHNNASYMKLIMVNEGAYKRAEELTEAPQQQGTKMNTTFVKALKIAAMGGQLSEAQLKALQVSKPMQQVLESKATAQRFMRKIVESKKALREGEIDTAQTTLAAQDIADQIQTMIEKFADIQYKELPALHDSIRNSQGVEAAEAFNASLLQSLSALTGSLEGTKQEVNNAVAVLTGQEVASGMDDMDLDIDGIEADDGMGSDMDLDLDMELGDEETGSAEFDLDLEADDEVVDLGRERR